MKVTMTSDFTWHHDGVNPTVITAGTEVESPIAENAVALGAAVEQKAIDEAPLNKAMQPPKRK